MANRPTTGKNIPVIAILSLLSIVLATISASRAGLLRNNGAVAAVSEQEPMGLRVLGFNDHADGSVEVIDVALNSTLLMIGSGEGSFLRGILRSLTRERRAKGYGNDMPFELRAEATNRLFFIDKATGTTLLLNAFGPENVASFERFLDMPVMVSEIAGT